MLGTLEDELALAGKVAAAQWISNCLHLRLDAPTRMGFKLKPDGRLLEAPTLRTFLLDLLTEKDPMMAVAWSETILASKDSPDEWAVSMRNLARVRQDAESRGFLKEKAMEMIRHDPWVGSPSVGFLEAFDVFVHLRDPQVIPNLSQLANRMDNQAVAHAAFIALDRLVIERPEAALNALLQESGALNHRVEARGNMVARANIAEAGQRKLVEDYLLRSEMTSPELEAFASTFPNANFFVSNNLLTQSSGLTRAELINRDRASLNVLRDWLQDPRFGRIRPALALAEKRLSQFVQQANQR